MLLEFILYYEVEVLVSLPCHCHFFILWSNFLMTLICIINYVCGLLWGILKSVKYNKVIYFEGSKWVRTGQI